MPLAPPKLCPKHGKYLGRRCGKCEEERDKKRGNSNSRGYDSKWRMFSKFFLEKNPICSKEGCEEFATQVDHIKALVDGGEKFDLENLQGFCASHHSQKTGRDNVKHPRIRSEIPRR